MELTRRDRATKSPLAPSRPSFTIALVARDIQLWDLCQECANAIETAHCKIIQHDPGQATDISADLLIWDVDSTPWPIGSQASTQSNQEQLFLIGRKQLREFLTDMPLGAGSTLLKPLSLRTLQIFLEQAVARWRDSFLADIDNSDDPQDSYAKDALQCLLMANLKLQEYDQDRTNFLARAVHDFRAPLMAASGYCSLLLEDAMGPLNGEQTDVVRRILHSVDKLTGMASAMLQLSAGKHVVRVPELKESNLPSCINNAVHELEPQALEKHIGISVNLLEPDRPLYFEQRQIERVVVNLLENACKFTPKGGAIEVRGGAVYPPAPAAGAEAGPNGTGNPTGYRVDVIDTGTGILPEHLENIFEEYTSYGGAHDRSGGGLGLAICKMIVSAHRGRIWAENVPGGTMVSFVLPFGQYARKPIEGLANTCIAAGAVS